MTSSRCPPLQCVCCDRWQWCQGGAQSPPCKNGSPQPECPRGESLLFFRRLDVVAPVHKPHKIQPSKVHQDPEAPLHSQSASPPTWWGRGEW